MHLVLGDQTEHTYRLTDYSRYYAQVRDRFLAFTAAFSTRYPNATYPERVEHCQFCPWRDLCADRWKDDDHLNQVAGITRTQIKRLRAETERFEAELAHARARLETRRAIARLNQAYGVLP